MSKKTNRNDEPPRRRKSIPPMSSEARENQMIALAIDAAEEQMRNGTASSGIIVHYLKLASEKERLTKEILEKQRDLIVAKTKALESNERMESLYEDALRAMRTYSGDSATDDE